MKSTHDASLHNQELLAFVDTITSDCHRAKSQDDIEHIAGKIEEYAKTSTLKYRHTKAWRIAIFCGFIAMMMWFVGDVIAIHGSFLNGNIYYLIVIGCLSIAGSIVLVKSYAAKHRIVKKISDQLLFRSHLIHNHLESPGFSGYSLRSSWSAKFMGFNRGDESQFIDRYYTGSYDFGEIHIDYELFRFHYVVVTEVAVTTYNPVTKKNETKKEERRYTHYRYGMIMDFPYAKGMCISREGYTYPEKWTTVSEKFNKLFTVTGDDRMTCAQVLQPTVVLDLIDSLGKLSRMTLEISRRSSLCISCTTALAPFHQNVMLSDTEDFLDALRHPETNHRIMRVLHGIGMMLKFNDKNFS